MNKLILKIIVVISCYTSTYAQMASSSFFSEMKSINPAVIGGREFGQYSAVGGKDKIEKEQIVDEINGEVSTTEIDIDTLTFFRGGKSGGFLTTELSLIKNSGTRVITVDSPTTDPTTISNDISFSHMELGVGLGKFFGLSLARQSYEFSSKFSFTFGGNTFSEDIKEDITSNIIKAGAVLPLSNFKFAGYFERASLTIDKEEFKVITGYDKSSTTEATNGVGLGIGYENKALHLELGYEKSLSSGSPTRISGTGEIRFWKIALGYTGRLYQNGFKDNDKLVFNELALSPDDESEDSRVEHIFNFAYGASGGFSVGGSASFSEVETKETNPLTSAMLGKLDTTIKSTSVMVKVGYVY